MKKKSNFYNAFTIQTSHPIEKMNFSQRRYQGFRGKTEFDKKRIVLNSKNTFSVHGYENYMCQSTYVLFEEQLPENLEIAFINFIEDINPKYLLVIINDTLTSTSSLYLKQIVKNELYFDDGK